MSIIYAYQDVQLDEQASQLASAKAQAVYQQQTQYIVPYNKVMVTSPSQASVDSQSATTTTKQRDSSLDDALASQIADLLIEETIDSENPKRKKTPFVKQELPDDHRRALPGDQSYFKNVYFMGICNFSAIFYICLNLFVNGFVFSWWGQGDGLIITISITQLLCASYTILLSMTSNLNTLTILYNIRFAFVGVAGLSLFPVGLITVLSFVAYSQSDQMAMLVFNSNVLSFSSFTTLPFVIVVIITSFLWQMRYGEIQNREIRFDNNYHYGPSQASAQARQQSMSTKESRDLTIRLLMRYLEEPDRQVAMPRPDLQIHRPCDFDVMQFN